MRALHANCEVHIILIVIEANQVSPCNNTWNKVQCMFINKICILIEADCINFIKLSWYENYFNWILNFKRTTPFNNFKMDLGKPITNASEGSPISPPLAQYWDNIYKKDIRYCRKGRASKELSHYKQFFWNDLGLFMHIERSIALLKDTYFNIICVVIYVHTSTYVLCPMVSFRD